MKKIILFLIVFSCVCYSQDNFWEQTSAPSNANVSAFAINSSGNVFAGTSGGILKSTDNGDNWLEIAEIPSAYLLINTSDVIFVGIFYRNF